MGDSMGIEAIITIIGLTCSAFWALVIRPLQQAIAELRNLIVEVRKDLKDENEKRAKVEIRLSVVEEKVDNLEKGKQQ
jgi:hypothetical protein